MKLYAILLAALWSCSSSEHHIAVTFSGNTAAFDDSQVSDIVFVVTNVAANNQMLDIDNNGIPDSFVFPKTCGANIPANCGYPNQAGSVSIGSFPLNFTYKIEAFLRSASGATLYPGTRTFVNSKDTTTLDISL